MNKYNFFKMAVGGLFAAALVAGAFVALSGDAGTTMTIVWPIGNAPELG